MRQNQAYPALNKFAKQNGYNENSSVMEMYDAPNKYIFYRKEIIKINKMIKKARTSNTR